jgi:putative membrane protein
MTFASGSDKATGRYSIHEAKSAASGIVMMHNNPYYYGNGGTHWGLWIVMILAMLAFVGILAWAVVTIIRQRDGQRLGGAQAPPVGSSPDPLQILDERLARGEIEVDEYTRRRDLLRGAGPASPSR